MMYNFFSLVLSGVFLKIWWYPCNSCNVTNVGAVVIFFNSTSLQGYLPAQYIFGLVRFSESLQF